MINILVNLSKMTPLKILRKTIIITTFIDHTSLNEAITTLASCKSIIRNDFELLHISCALRRSTIGLYGSSNPNFTLPLSKNSKFTYHAHGYYKIRKGNNMHGYHDSLINIHSYEVLEHLKSLLN